MPEVSKVAEAQDVSGLIAALKRTHPDILLLDWHLASDDLYALVLLLRILEPRLKKVVVLSLSADDRPRALAAGADAFVSKGDPSEELLLALRLGESTVCLNLSERTENDKGSELHPKRIGS
jgi:DNA-binding NarL/FixJ family response regulator